MPDAVANRYCDLTLAHGTTTVCSYATIHPASVDAIFAAAQSRGQRIWAGKTCMDRNAPDGLRDTVQSAYDDSKAPLGQMAWGGPAVLCHHAAVFAHLDPGSTGGDGALWANIPIA
jgi:guanine deaminase